MSVTAVSLVSRKILVGGRVGRAAADGVGGYSYMRTIEVHAIADPAGD